MSRSRGQSMVEFAILSPILLLLVSGMLDLGRAYYYEVVTTDAARDAARFAIGYSAASGAAVGPGIGSVCDRATADLANVTLMGTSIGNVRCVTTTSLPGTSRPFYPAGSVPAPSANQAVVVVYCPAGGDCSTTAASPTNQKLSVTVYYGFSLLTPGMNNMVGGSLLTFQNTAVMTSLW